MDCLSRMFIRFEISLKFRKNKKYTRRTDSSTGKFVSVEVLLEAALLSAPSLVQFNNINETVAINNHASIIRLYSSTPNNGVILSRIAEPFMYIHSSPAPK